MSTIGNYSSPPPSPSHVGLWGSLSQWCVIAPSFLPGGSVNRSGHMLKMFVLGCGWMITAIVMLILFLKGVL